MNYIDKRQQLNNMNTINSEDEYLVKVDLPYQMELEKCILYTLYW